MSSEVNLENETQYRPDAFATGNPEPLQCDFCAHRCRIPPDRTGLCGVRYHVPGSPGQPPRIVTTVYGEIQTAATDPIEKKPLYHFLPGSRAFSIALGGCNFRCRFCQNDGIAFAENLGSALVHWEPGDLAEAWRRSEAPVLAYTYTEPAVWQDYLLDSGVEAAKQGARIVMVSNGFFTPQAVDRLLPVVEAFNIDLKGNEEFYRSLCRATDSPVIEAIRRIAPYRHVEVTTMLMERFHDDTVLTTLRDHLVDAGVQVWHLSRFHPAGKMLDEPATSEAFLRHALETVKTDRIPYLYAGNSRILEYQRTLCPRCGTLCVDRGAEVVNDLVRGACPRCGVHLYGVFQ